MTRDEAMQLAEQAGIEKWWNQANADQRSYEDAIVRLLTITASVTALRSALLALNSLSIASPRVLGNVLMLSNK